MSMYDNLNSMQQEAVFHTEGPVLILAGAGSGKTRVLTHRASYLIEEKGVNPWHIMAITFTNKAAGEMRERIDSLVGFGSESIWVSTFHSTCVRILRRHIDRLGYDTNFTIYDADDQKILMKDICKRLQIDTKIYKEKSFLGVISSAKDELISPEEFTLRAAGDFAKEKQAAVYREYQAALRKNNALDFDDLIVKTVELFQNDAEVLDYYQERFRYIMVDEYQDTNTAQFHLIKLLAEKYRNLCVVGDDDQSIYQFRGAKPKFILNFEKEYPDAKRYILDVNYRSSKAITDGAARVIMHNQNRYEKSVTTPNPQGMPVHVQEVRDASEEAGYVLGRIQALQQREIPFRTIAVLFRTNSDAGVLVEQLLAHQIPFRMKEKMTNIYDHFAVKDIQSYLRLAMGNKSRTDFLAIMNRPLRYLERGCLDQPEVSFEELRKYYEEKKWMLERIDQLEWDLKMMERMTPYTAIRHIRRRIGYDEYIKEYAGTRKMKAEDVFAVLDEVEERAKAYKTLEEWFTYIEKYRIQLEMIGQQRWQEEEAVSILTMHGAKGLEFDHVFVMEANEDVIPHKKAETKEEMEEERRMFYVAMTRAKKMLVISYVRKKNGKDMYPSRFVEELLGV